jgi:ABC-type transport system involved in cytochrome c biogenesis permease subunit
MRGQERGGVMGLPFWAGVLGAVVSTYFLVRAVTELKKGRPGHAQNAAMIHIVMCALLLPASLIIIAFNL